MLILSSKSPLAIVHYPDSGKVGLWSQSRAIRPCSGASRTHYWDDET